MDDRLYSYLLAHTREPPVLGALRADTAAHFATGARMQISPEQGAFMGWLVSSLGVRRIVEVGVFTGYSSIAMALALPPGGRLVACDRDPRAMEMARDYWQRAGVADKASVAQCGVLCGWCLCRCCAPGAVLPVLGPIAAWCGSSLVSTSCGQVSSS
jgi:predicted O-methyltransferase YrrM